jgi:hypothetical protein
MARKDSAPPITPTAPSSADAGKGADAARPGALARWLRRLRLYLILSPLVLAAGLALYLFAALHFAYSTGDRAGFVQKFSKRGWVCKTWEGELAMANLPGAMPEVFRFSVRDEAVAAQVNQQIGERVALTYEQQVGLPSCFGETEYFVVKVRRVQP